MSKIVKLSVYSCLLLFAGLMFNLSVAAPLGSAGDTTPDKNPQHLGSDTQRQPLMESALKNLQRAEKALQRASWNKGGHRVKALAHVRQAIDEVRKGMAYANQR